MLSLETGSIIGMTLIIIDLWAIAKIFQSTEKTAVRILWMITVALIPLFGFTFWYFMGPRKEKPSKEQLHISL